MNRMNLAYTGGKLLQYKGGEEFMYTGLQVAKDPGVWVVWLGCTLMMVGIYVAFLHVTPAHLGANRERNT